MKYLILQNPGHNRVYYLSADKLALAEFKIASQRLSVDCIDIKIINIENVQYLFFETKEILSEKDLQILSRLSFVFALFIYEEEKGRVCMIPKKTYNYEYLDSKIGSLLKYQGKTNELFTKMMINIALLSSDYNYSEAIEMLDPLAGKGTTLFEGTVYGFNVYGIETELKLVEETNIFFKKYIETERLKHKYGRRQIYGTSKSDAVYINEFEYALTKEDFKAKETKKLGVICGNSKDAFKFFKKEKFHIIVGDLPYGIKHGSKSLSKSSHKSRNPSELLNGSLPDWYKVLKKGGVIVMAWNSFVLSKKILSDIFTSNGFEVLRQAPYNEFMHMVDKSIKRDVLVAKKK